MPNDIIEGVQKKAKINIISDVTICKAPIILSKEKITEEHCAEHHITELLKEIVEDAMEIAEKENL